MRAREDVSCFHEPFMYYYYKQLGIRTMPHFDAEDDHPREYEAIWAMLQKQALKSPVFVKDMSYYIYQKVLSDESLCKQLTNTFLIRNPLKSIISYHKLDAALSLEEIGLDAQWNLYHGLEEKMGVESVVIEAESVQENPEKMLQWFCNSIGLKYKSQALKWENTAIPKAWESVQTWHAEISNSTSIKRPEYSTDAELEQQFIDYAKSAKAPQLIDYLHYHRKYYDLLKSVARTQQQSRK